jgi:hypothetical protein
MKPEILFRVIGDGYMDPCSVLSSFGRDAFQGLIDVPEFRSWVLEHPALHTLVSLGLNVEQGLLLIRSTSDGQAQSLIVAALLSRRDTRDVWFALTDIERDNVYAFMTRHTCRRASDALARSLISELKDPQCDPVRLDTFLDLLRSFGMSGNQRMSLSVARELIAALDVLVNLCQRERMSTQSALFIVDLLGEATWSVSQRSELDPVLERLVAAGARERRVWLRLLGESRIASSIWARAQVTSPEVCDLLVGTPPFAVLCCETDSKNPCSRVARSLAVLCAWRLRPSTLSQHPAIVFSITGIRDLRIFNTVTQLLKRSWPDVLYDVWDQWDELDVDQVLILIDKTNWKMWNYLPFAAVQGVMVILLEVANLRVDARLAAARLLRTALKTVADPRKEPACATSFVVRCAAAGMEAGLALPNLLGDKQFGDALVGNAFAVARTMSTAATLGKGCVVEAMRTHFVENMMGLSCDALQEMVRGMGEWRPRKMWDY